jgi:hypothetical protein
LAIFGAVEPIARARVRETTRFASWKAAPLVRVRRRRAERASAPEMEIRDDVHDRDPQRFDRHRLGGGG